MTFGYKLKSLRGARVISQRELAEALEMDSAYLSRMENDVANHLPSVQSIERIAAALNLERAESDHLYVLANKLPPDVARKLISNPRLLDRVRKLR